MSFQKAFFLFGCLLTLTIYVSGRGECPDGVCRPICDEGEIENGTCCRGRKCCVVDVTCDDGTCICRDECLPSETSDGTCTCGDNDGKVCCRPGCSDGLCNCRDQCFDFEIADGNCNCPGEETKLCCKACIQPPICQEDLGGQCRLFCDEGEAPFDTCCDDKGVCCLPCASTCTGKDVTCEYDVTTCSDGKNDLGGCCDGNGKSGRCCSDIVHPCTGALRPGSTVPFSCKKASSDECGSSTGGSVNTGYCPANSIKCCPECGWDCFDLHGGQTCKANNQCNDQITTSNDDCCSPTQCCGDAA